MKLRKWGGACVVGVALLANGCDRAHVRPVVGPTETDAPVAGGGAPLVAGPELTLVHPVEGGMTVDGVKALCDDNLAVARRIVDGIKEVDITSADALTWEATLGRLDDAFLAIGNASEFPYLIGVAHPAEAVRTAARECETKTDKLVTGIFLDAALGKVVKAYAATNAKLSAEQRRFVDHTLRDFRRNGIDLGPAPQTRLKVINKEITQIGQRFIA